MKDEDLDRLLSELKSVHSDLRPVSTDLVAVGEWVRLKCRYGCRAYGRHLCCPPFAPTPGETRRVLAEYSHAVLVRFQIPAACGAAPEQAKSNVRDGKMLLQRAVYELERKAFLCGSYKALGMSSSPCHLCPTCVVEEKLEKNEDVGPLDALKCRHKEIMRPSMEACGIDVFKTLQNAGYNPRVLKDFTESLEIFGLVLLD